LAFHPYPQVIRAFCNMHRCGPQFPSACPGVDRPLSGPSPRTTRDPTLPPPSGPASGNPWAPRRTPPEVTGEGGDARFPYAYVLQLKLARDEESPTHDTKGTPISRPLRPCPGRPDGRAGRRTPPSPARPTPGRRCTPKARAGRTHAPRPQTPVAPPGNGPGMHGKGKGAWARDASGGLPSPSRGGGRRPSPAPRGCRTDATRLYRICLQMRAHAGLVAKPGAFPHGTRSLSVFKGNTSWGEV